MPVQLTILKKPAGAPKGVPLFCIVRNEMYFLPHLLEHYRALGIAEFWFLDDQSSDGTDEFLRSQPDCGILRSNYSYAAEVNNKRRFGTFAKWVVPHRMLRDRWVLTVDADEFLFLPPGYPTVESFAAALARDGLQVARALMLDFFPATLSRLADADPGAPPWVTCPWFDAYSKVEWPDGAERPAAGYLQEAVRPRMLAELKARGTPMGDVMADYNPASLHKVPLLYWTAKTDVRSPHSSNVPSSDRTLLAMAHFKLYPGIQAKVQHAIESRGYWLQSSEYRFLDIALGELQDWPLAGPRTRRFNSVKDLVDAGLLYYRERTR